MAPEREKSSQNGNADAGQTNDRSMLNRMRRLLGLSNLHDGDREHYDPATSSIPEGASSRGQSFEHQAGAGTSGLPNAFLTRDGNPQAEDDKRGPDLSDIDTPLPTAFRGGGSGGGDTGIETPPQAAEGWIGAGSASAVPLQGRSTNGGSSNHRHK